MMCLFCCVSKQREAAMSDLKTQPTQASVLEFINQIENESRRSDCLTVLEMMRAATGAEAVMWGSSIVGFGSYHYRYASGREGDWMLVGFSPRKNDLTLYLTCGTERFKEQLPRLGKYKTSGGSCLYLKKLADVDLTVLKELIQVAVENMAEKHADR
jgi:hypothetical protein